MPEAVGGSTLLLAVAEITLAVRVHHPDVRWAYFHRTVEWPAVPRVGELLAVDHADHPVELREISWDLEVVDAALKLNPRVGELLRVDYDENPVALGEISWDLEGRARIDLPPVEPEIAADADAVLARLDAAGWHRGNV